MEANGSAEHTYSAAGSYTITGSENAQNRTGRRHQRLRSKSADRPETAVAVGEWGFYNQLSYRVVHPCRMGHAGQQEARARGPALAVTET